MFTKEDRQELLQALKAELNKEYSKEEAIANLQKIGVLTKDGKPSPNYYPANSNA